MTVLVRRLHRVLAKDVLSPLKRELQYHRVRPRVSTMYLTYRCTSKCKTCTVWKRGASAEGEMGLKEWCRVSDILHGYGVRITELFGGDVFLRKDILFPLIRHLKNRSFTIHMPTNSNLIDNDVARDLVKGPIDYIYFSVDGVASVQDTIRGIQGSFSNVSRAVELVKGHRKEGRIPRLVCNTTVSNLNIGKLREIAEFALDAGFDEIHYEYVGEMAEDQIAKSEIDGLIPTPFYVRQGESVLLTKDEAIELKSELRRIKQCFSRGKLFINTVNIDTLSVENLYKGTIPNKRCYVERTEVTIDPYGNIIACPVINNYIFGNLLDETFNNIWNNNKHRNFRKHQNSGQIYLCRHCILGVQRNHSLLTAWKRNLLMR